MSRASLLAFLFATVSAAGAHAQVLVSADNGAAQVYTNFNNALYAMDGTNTALSFRTTKTNEAVTFSFTGARCGIEQTAQQSVSQINESYVQGFFYLDGSFVNTQTGNANTLCYYDQLPQAQYMIAWGAAHMEQRVVIAQPGLHTIGVLLQVGGSFGDGTGIYPVFGQSHTEVRH